MRKGPLFLLTTVILASCSAPDPTVLVFSATSGWRHDSIPAGIEMFDRLAAEEGFVVTATEDHAVFSSGQLSRYDVVVFLLTTQDVLDEAGQRELERFIQAGGGYVGIHSASDTEYDWPWYGRLVGGYFTGHPPGTPEGVITVVDTTFAATSHLPRTWTKVDEWYDFRSTNRFLNVVLTVDETTYKAEGRGPRQTEKPIAWYHEFDGGRSFYTALGHTAESYTDPLFVQHIASAVRWAAGATRTLDYSAPTVRPRDADFSVVVLADTLDEPMELDVLPDGRVLFVERGGEVHLVTEEGTDTVVLDLEVHDGHEDGLLGIALDPSFVENRWVYLYYSVPGASMNRLARFTWEEEGIARDSEVAVLEVPVDTTECCHSGGSVEFGPDGLLYVSLGDDTNPFQSDSFSPSDERAGRAPFDAQRTAANTDDLRGKILRIRPEADGTYSIPEGNLFPADGSRGRPEIYAMGLRNPFRINVDQRTGWLYWGDIGPDAVEDDSLRGPRGYDELNQARGPGFFGWPYFVGDNFAYAKYDFATGRIGDFAVGAAPVNESPNNTGRTFLPPTQGPWIWYPYGKSDAFPLLGEGGRSAMAGPVYYQGDHADAAGRFPDYYSGRLFFHEWMRNLIVTVDIDEHGGYGHMERFLANQSFSRPVDLRFGPDGRLYVLDYGNTWNAENPDARLLVIAYTP